MVKVKISRANNVRRVDITCFEDLYNSAVSFPPKMTSFVLKYQDDDGDYVMIVDQDDLNEALEIIGDDTLRVLITNEVLDEEFEETPKGSIAAVDKQMSYPEEKKDVLSPQEFYKDLLEILKNGEFNANATQIFHFYSETSILMILMSNVAMSSLMRMLPLFARFLAKYRQVILSEWDRVFGALDFEIRVTLPILMKVCTQSEIINIFLQIVKHILANGPDDFLPEAFDQRMHWGTQCSCCDSAPIVGTIYSCVICDWKCCEACDEVGLHEHPVLRITEPMPLSSRSEFFITHEKTSPYSYAPSFTNYHPILSRKTDANIPLNSMHSFGQMGSHLSVFSSFPVHSAVPNPFADQKTEFNPAPMTAAPFSEDMFGTAWKVDETPTAVPAPEGFVHSAVPNPFANQKTEFNSAPMTAAPFPEDMYGTARNVVETPNAVPAPEGVNFQNADTFSIPNGMNYSSKGHTIFSTKFSAPEQRVREPSMASLLCQQENSRLNNQRTKVSDSNCGYSQLPLSQNSMFHTSIYSDESGLFNSTVDTSGVPERSSLFGEDIENSFGTFSSE